MVVSSLSQVEFVNLGPLTSTYSAPAACLTETARIGLARPTGQAFPAWFETCDIPTWGDCLPYGEERDQQYASRLTEHGADDAVYYHSPGVACPASWTTAARAVKSSDGSLSVSGIYDPTITGQLPVVQPTPNIMLEAMEAGDTAILCCPTGFTADVALGCHKSLPLDSYTADVVCSTSLYFNLDRIPVTFTYGGEVQTTGIMVSEVGSDHDVATRTTAAPHGATEAWAAATYVPGVTLIQGGGDGGDDEAPEPTQTSSQHQETTLVTSTLPATTDEGSDEAASTTAAPTTDSEDDEAWPTTYSEPVFITESPCSCDHPTTTGEAGASHTTVAPHPSSPADGPTDPGPEDGNGEETPAPPADGPSSPGPEDGTGEDAPAPPAEEEPAPPAGTPPPSAGNSLSITMTALCGVAALSGLMMVVM